MARQHGQHSSASAEWWTPPEIVTPARNLFGGFDLDAASCIEANRFIQARKYFTAENDGLLDGDKRREWNADVGWCNPPSKRGENSAWEWWVHGAREWLEGRTRTLFFMVFNPSTFFQVAASHARISQVPSPQMATRVEFRERVRYVRATTQLGLSCVDWAHMERGDAPPHGSAILMLTSERKHAERFGSAYEHLGDCVVPLRFPERANA
jgi:hypothetical protein